MRRKNPHPKRAENARTVLKVPKGEREEFREKEEEPLCFNNKIYLTLRAFCSEPTNAAIVERCYKKAHVKSPCARRILRLCAEGCFESEKYEHVANARECDDAPL